MTRRQSHGLLLGIFALSFALRIEALFDPTALHPDESYQYVEPAYARLTGAGVVPWEYDAGVRSWVLPGFHGAFMALARSIGIQDVWLPLLLRFIWALLSLGIVVASYRASAAIARTLVLSTNRSLQSDVSQLARKAGLMGAALCGCFPWIVQLSVHTLSELPATIAIVSGLALCSELSTREQIEARRLAMWAGGFVAAGALLRITYAPCALVLVLAIACSRHPNLLIPCILGAALPILVFGIVDWVTWGAPFVSYIRYFKVNALEGVAASYGVEPAGFYYELLRSRLPLGIWPLAILCIVGLRGGWIQTLTAALTVFILSLQPHKEERFIVLFWPLCLSAAAGTAGAIAGLLPRLKWRRAAWLAMVGFTAFVLVEARRHDAIIDDWHMGDRMVAQTWLGKRDDVSGILIDDEGCSGGEAWNGKPLPMLRFQRRLLGNKLFSHAILTASSPEEAAASAAGFTLLHRQGALVILARTYATTNSPTSGVSSGTQRWRTASLSP